MHDSNHNTSDYRRFLQKSAIYECKSDSVTMYPRSSRATTALADAGSATLLIIRVLPHALLSILHTLCPLSAIVRAIVLRCLPEEAKPETRSGMSMSENLEPEGAWWDSEEGLGIESVTPSRR